MNNKIEKFKNAFMELFIFLGIPLTLFLSVFYMGYEFIYYIKHNYSYEYVYQYEDIDGNIGLSDKCTYNKEHDFLSATDNQVCYINNVKTLVKTIEIYGAKKCYIWDDYCENKIYTDLDSLVDYYGNPYY